MCTECAERRDFTLKKNTKIIIAVIAIIIIILAAVFGGIAIHDKGIIKDAEKNLSVTDATFELQQSDITVSVDDVLNTNNVECTALFSNNAGSIEINASEVKNYKEQITISLLKPILFNEELKLDVKISIVDTTVPEFTESIDEITITEGENVNILEHFKATDLSGDVNLSATEFDNNSAGEQTVTITATDKNNNSSTKDIKIIIEPKKEETTASCNGNNNNTKTKNSKSSNNSSKNSSSGNSSGSSSGGSSGSSSGGSGSGSSSSSEDKKPEVKNVSPKDVQSKVNAYIRSKGITVDSSMTPNNASWTSTCWINQDDLNNGYCLKNLKGGVDYTINMCGKDTIISMHCYYDKNQFYICYW